MKVIDRETVRQNGFQILAVILLVFLLAIDFLRPIVNGLENINYYLRCVQIFSALSAGLFLSRSERSWHPWLIPLVISVGWVFLNSMIRGGEALRGGFNHGVYERAVFLAFVCFPAAFLMKKDQRLSFLKLLVGLWVAAMTILCAVGLYALFTGQRIPNLSGSMYLGMSAQERFSLFVYPTTASNEMYGAAIAALIGVVVYRRRIAKAACVLAFLVLYAGTSLSLGRAALLCLGMGCGLLVGFRAMERFRHICLKLLCVAAAAVVCTGASYFGSDLCVNLYNQTAPAAGAVSSGLIISSARAEETAAAEPAADADTLTSRTVTDGDFFSGRLYIWEAALKLLRNEPRVLLTGTSYNFMMSKVKLYLDPENPINGTYNHLHNIWLQALVAYGLPGLLLLLWFQWIFIRASLRILMDQASPYWHRAIIALPTALWGNELVDSITRLSATALSASMCIVFMGLVVAIGEDYRREKRAA